MAADLSFESSFWGDCCNTHEEETKHSLYAKLMGLQWSGSGQKLGNYGWDVGGKRILDIGGGPTSMLLRALNLKSGSVSDPLSFPTWVMARYQQRGIQLVQESGEDLNCVGYDEVWIYNVLQHAIDPQRVIQNARRAAPLLRMFEWIDLPPYEGHPHMLTAEKLNQWTASTGYVCDLKGENGCWGKSWSGIFTT